MAFGPEQTVTDDQSNGQEIETSRTYFLDFDSGEIIGIVDGLEAIRQFIKKAIMTARFRFLIYDSDYGSELDNFLGQNVTAEYLQAEIPRVFQEALSVDDRILEAHSFEFSRTGDQAYVTFTVDTVDGAITEEVTL